jgi:site-specific DNA recombinase
MSLTPVVFMSGEKDLTDYNHAFEFRVNGAVASRHVGEMKAKQKRTAIQRAQSGRAWWPTKVFGYSKPARDGTGVKPDQREAAAIRSAYADVRKGRSLKSIARDWNNAGLLTPRGNQWSGMALRALLLSPRNAGLRTYQPDKRKPPEVIGKADWSGIVSEATWREVRAKLTNPARLVPGAGFGAGRKHLLSGLARCSECGKPLSSAVPANTKDGKARYVCKTRGCLKVKRSVADVDAWVVGHIVKRLERDLDTLMVRKDTDTSAIVARLAEIETERNEAAAMVNAKTLTLTQLGVLNQGYDREETGLNAAMRDAEKSAVLETFEGVADVLARFDSIGLDRQRAVVNLLCTVTIHPGQAPRRPFDEDLVTVRPKH